MSGIIAYQPALRPALPIVYGPLEYREQRATFERMDEILAQSGLDQDFLHAAMKDQGFDPGERTAKENQRFAACSFVCLRGNVARYLLGLSHRDFCARLADSPLLQWFLHIGEIDSVKVYAKSSSHRFENWVKPESMRGIIDKLNVLSRTPNALDLKKPVTFDDAFFDTTVVKAPIHFPTDWLLLRDAARTLLKATSRIRREGLKHRMPQSPEAFLRNINKQCMAMSAQRRRKDGKRERKRILREMKKLDQRIAKHARSHLKLLQTRREETGLGEGEARLVERSIQGVLDQLPAAIKQAHERIIGGRTVSNDEKILSLYDNEVEVIVRGKANAEVEFGNKLTLVENGVGMIIDYCLHKGNPADCDLVIPSVLRLKEAGIEITKVWGDRGTFSAANESLLAEHGIQSGLCPRNPDELSQRLKEPGVAEGMKRRGATEARIAVFKNVFVGSPAKGRSFAARQRACGWAVLAHNLWVLARLPVAQALQKAA
jgi:hypothetical protein